MTIESDEERILRDLVFIPKDYTHYREFGKGFVKIRDQKTGKMFEIKVKEVKK